MKVHEGHYSKLQIGKFGDLPLQCQQFDLYLKEIALKTNVLIIGSGGREHAIVWKIAQSPRVGNIFVAPGNGGTCQIAQNVAIDAKDIRGLLEFAKSNQIDLTVVGSEESLAAGVVDAFQAVGQRIFGPTKAAAEIETSKAFSKVLMVESSIPTAAFEIFDNFDQSLMYVAEHGFPVVIKASGLAKGKGAYICHRFDQAEKALLEILIERRYGDGGKQAIVEDYLFGREISIHVLCDGQSSLILPPAQDHKSIYDDDQGENTGGMGTIVPVPWITPEDLRVINDSIVRPTLNALERIEGSFRGLLFPGVKMTPVGPMVLEFNVRPGDPEWQCYMRLLKTDVLDIWDACVDGTLANLKVEWHPGFAVCVVLASAGYPGDSTLGIPIHGISDAEIPEDIVVFHAGTEISGVLKTSGGRVLGVTATGPTLQSAIDRAYEAVRLIHFEGMQYRRDIGAKSL